MPHLVAHIQNGKRYPTTPEDDEPEPEPDPSPPPKEKRCATPLFKSCCSHASSRTTGGAVSKSK